MVSGNSLYSRGLPYANNDKRILPRILQRVDVLGYYRTSLRIEELRQYSSLEHSVAMNGLEK
jgi:hypothetical protein